MAPGAGSARTEEHVQVAGMTRAGRARVTRERILDAAERLFAERGLLAVSNRQIAEAAGQGNNTVVGYHFGSKADLVRAVVTRHGEPMERARAAALAAVPDRPTVRDWVTCLVVPLTSYLDTLPPPTWYMRFAVQVLSDPELRLIMIGEALSTPSLRTALDGLRDCLPDLPETVLHERAAMTSTLIVNLCADRERTLAQGAVPLRATWDGCAAGLVDAIVALWAAPVTDVTGARP